MAIHWRKDGRLVCGAMERPEMGDTYIDDRLHYQLSQISRATVADVDHEENGLWHWVHPGEGLGIRGKPEREVLDKKRKEVQRDEDNMDYPKIRFYCPDGEELIPVRESEYGSLGRDELIVDCINEQFGEWEKTDCTNLTGTEAKNLILQKLRDTIPAGVK